MVTGGADGNSRSKHTRSPSKMSGETLCPRSTTVLLLLHQIHNALLVSLNDRLEPIGSASDDVWRIISFTGGFDFSVSFIAISIYLALLLAIWIIRLPAYCQCIFHRWVTLSLMLAERGTALGSSLEKLIIFGVRFFWCDVNLTRKG